MRTAALYARPAGTARIALNNATQALASNVTDLALKAAVATLDAVEPVVALRASANAAFVEPIAALGEQLAEEASELVEAAAEGLPEDLRASVIEFNARAEAAAAELEAAALSGGEEVEGV